MAAKTETGVEQIGWGLQNYLRVEQGTFVVGFNYLVNSPFFSTALNSYTDSVVLPSASWAHNFCTRWESADTATASGAETRIAKMRTRACRRLRWTRC